MSEEKTSACLVPLTVQRMVEAVGIDSLPDDIAGSLAEDVTHRMKEVICLSAQFMKRCRRSCLTLYDIEKVLELSSLPPVLEFAESQPETCVFDDGQDTCVRFATQDTIILSDAESESTIKSGFNQPRISSKWIHVDGEMSISKGLGNIRNVPTSLHHYFSQTVNALIGHNDIVRYEALKHLRKSSNISPLIPYFVNFVSNMKAVSHDIDQLFMLLQTVHALVCNPHLTLLGYLKALTTSVLYCVLEPLTASINPINDHWRLRDYGSRILSLLSRSEGGQNHNLKFISESIKKFLLDPTRPLCSHYGAIVTVNSLGVESIESILVPNIAKYYHSCLKILIDGDSNDGNINLKEDAAKVVGLLLHSLQMVFSNSYVGNTVAPLPGVTLLQLHKDSVEMFGDSYALRMKTFSNNTVDKLALDKFEYLNVQPVLIRSPLYGNCSRSSRRSAMFSSQKLRRKLRFSLARFHSNPPNLPAEYSHTQYFALNLRLVFIGKNFSTGVKRLNRGYIDLCDIVL